MLPSLYYSAKLNFSEEFLNQMPTPNSEQGLKILTLSLAFYDIHAVDSIGKTQDYLKAKFESDPSNTDFKE